MLTHATFTKLMTAALVPGDFLSGAISTQEHGINHPLVGLFPPDYHPVSFANAILRKDGVAFILHTAGNILDRVPIV